MAAPDPRRERTSSSTSATTLLGRSYEFVAIISEKYSCPVCLELLFVNPRLLSCCGHHVCEPCLTKIQNSKMAGPTRCPLCQSTDFTTMLDKGMAREVRDFQVYCPNTNEGCDWVGEVGQIEDHLSPRVSSNRARMCQFEKVACSNKGCEEEVLRRDLDGHQNEQCRYRIVTCEFCESYKSTYDDVVKNHYSVCVAYPVDCPNVCGEQSLPRSKLQEHLEKCPLQFIDCDFKSVGCEIRRRRDGIKGHLDMHTHYHMKLLCEAVSNKSAQMEKFSQLEQQIQSLSGQVATLQEENKKTREENSDLRNLNNQLHSDVLNTSKRVEQLDKQLQTVTSELEQEREQRQSLASQVGEMKREANQITANLEEEQKIKAASVIQMTSLKTSVGTLREKVDTVHKSYVVLEGEVESLKKSINGHKDHTRDEVVKRVDEVSTKLEQKLQKVKGELGEKVKTQSDQIKDVHKNLVYVEQWITPRPPYAFTVSRFQERKTNKEAFVSPPFYHTIRGYKMCVRVDVYGMNNHVAVFCCIMRGEHDDLLKWPFLGAVEIRLQNHLGDHNHFMKEIRFDVNTDEKKSGRVKTGDKNYLHGHPQFIAHNKLALDPEKNCQYLKGDALDFEVVQVKLFQRPANQ